MTYEEIKNQLERYGGEPRDEVLPLLDAVAELNDSLAHMRHAGVLRQHIASIHLKLIVIETRYGL